MKRHRIGAWEARTRERDIDTVGGHVWRNVRAMMGVFQPPEQRNRVWKFGSQSAYDDETHVCVADDDRRGPQRHDHRHRQLQVTFFATQVGSLASSQGESGDGNGGWGGKTGPAGGREPRWRTCIRCVRGERGEATFVSTLALGMLATTIKPCWDRPGPHNTRRVRVSQKSRFVWGYSRQRSPTLRM